MFRWGKIVGVSLLVLTTVGLGVAQAGVFRADRYPVTVTTNANVPDHVWTLGGMQFSCSGPQVDGKLESPSATITFTVLFPSCRTPYGNPSIEFAPCDYRATLGETTTGGKFKKYLELDCGFKWLNFRWATCEARVPSQSLSPAYAWNGSEWEGGGLFLEAAVSHTLKYQVTADGFLCPFSGVGFFSDGSYVGRYRLFGDYLDGTYVRVYGAHS